MPQDAIQALDVALKHSAMMSAFLVPVARAFYNPGTARTLGGGAEVMQRHSSTPIRFDLLYAQHGVHLHAPFDRALAGLCFPSTRIAPLIKTLAVNAKAGPLPISRLGSSTPILNLTLGSGFYGHACETLSMRPRAGVAGLPAVAAPVPDGADAQH